MLSQIGRRLAWLAWRLEGEDAQALAEYGLLLALIAAVCIIAITALGLAISGFLGGITGAF